MSSARMTALTRWVLVHKKLVVGSGCSRSPAFAAMGPAGDALSTAVQHPGQRGVRRQQPHRRDLRQRRRHRPARPRRRRCPRAPRSTHPASRAELAAALAKVRAALPDARVASYASTDDRAFVSGDGRTTFALVYDPGARRCRPRAGRGARGAEVARRRDRRRRAGAGHRARRAPRRRRRRQARARERACAVEALVAALGALLVLAFVFASWMAIVPLLMALVAIPTTFLLIWPLATATDVSVIVKFLVALVGLGHRDRLRAADRRALARGAPAREHDQ